MSKAEQMAEIEDAVENLTESPLYDFRTEHGYHAVIGEGSLDADIMFIGEAPGKQEAKTGRPFVGASGRVLDELLAAIGLARADVYITNVVKDRPPENRDPTRAELDLYTPFLQQQIAIIQPQVIATLGRFAMEFVLAHFGLDRPGQKISRLHGEAFETDTENGRLTIVPLYHPAVALYRRSRKETLVADFETLKKLI